MGGWLSARELHHVRGGRDVLSLGSLDVAPGSRLCVLGANGAGKTTLLRLLAGVERPRLGQVSLDGVSVTGGGVAVRRRIAYTAQRPVLLSTTARRNVELPLRWRRVPRKRCRSLANAALERLRIGHLAERQARSLSGGEQQRVNLARAVALDPDVLLLDEPAASLDAESRTAFLDDLGRALADRATTVVHVSHRVEEAMRLADQVIALINGRVHQVGSAAELIHRPISADVARLVGYDNLVPAHVRSDGTVLIGQTATGLRLAGYKGPASVAVFANGVRPAAEGDAAGVPARVRHVSLGPGYWTVSLTVSLPGVTDLAMTLPIGTPVAPEGSTVRVVFDPSLSTVLPATAATRQPHPLPVPALDPATALLSL
ncbi:MAG: ATP-binding cassette domain-containing protein [Actinophytocola sp.]|nr:ATP-binding cassette domain-containing protein [Actinophytocola sp.]